MKTLTIVDRWRCLALEFHAIEEMLNQLPCGFAPHDLARLRGHRPMTGAVRGVIDFLLHVWNTQNEFDLGQIQAWDPEHRRAFIGWVNGQTMGRPCHYF